MAGSRTLRLTASLLAFLAACSSGASRTGTTPSPSPPSPSVAATTAPPTPSGTTAPAPTRSATPTPTRSRPAPIHVAGLPEQGVAVETTEGVDLYNFFSGGRVAHLDGFRIYRSTDAPGHLILQRGGTFYLLEEFERILRPLASMRAADRRNAPPDNEPDFPVPTTHGKPLVGHWRYSAADPRYGDRFLAQWSGECESPTAFFVDRDEGDVEPVTGEDDPADAPESFGLGWNKHGQAVVFLPAGACGAGSDPPGVYLFRKAGEGHLLVEAPPTASARMWGTAIAD